jgi:hypothetical protein
MLLTDFTEGRSEERGDGLHRCIPR